MSRRGDGAVALIGVFKLIKAAVLGVAGVNALAMRPERLAEDAEGAARWLGVVAGRPGLEHAIARLWALDPRTEKRLGLVVLVYAAIFAVEGVGLVLRKRWAEWLTVAVTGSFIPLEIYELVEHYGPGKVAALAVNVAIVAYLVWRRVRGTGSGTGTGTIGAALSDRH
jgi:uncharacterized membrane protein (DUF2068 family)